MRRKEKEISDPNEIDSVIRSSQVCRLAMWDGTRPYLVPLCFGYRDRTLYFHSALEGRKMDILRNHPRVCFEFDTGVAVVEAEKACAWGVHYQSVIGYGDVIFLENEAQKQEALAQIMAQYSDRQFVFSKAAVEKTAVFKVPIDHMSGKQSV